MAKHRAPKPIPKFASEAEERAFWETHDTAEYVHWSQARLGVFPALKPSTANLASTAGRPPGGAEDPGEPA
jgi:hypothetical protein